jgi:non-ribosomal peptide synthetase-like protein
VLDIDASLGEGAQLGHASSLHAGQAVPAGERRHGSPAHERTEVDQRLGGPASVGTLRRFLFGALELLGVLAVPVPLAVGGVVILGTAVPGLDALLSSTPSDLKSWAHYRDALVTSFVLFFGVLVAGLLFVLTVPRALNLAIAPDNAYRLYGFRYAAQRGIARLTNIPFFTHLFGDSSFIVHYLRWLGYDLSGMEQTGSNFGLDVKHENPYLVSVGSGTMVADGLSVANADYSSTAFRVSGASIGAHNFVGNYVALPSQGRTGDNCLLATKVEVPADGELRENTGLLGSPSFEIPRSVQRDGRFDDLRRGRELRRRLAAKNRHNAATIGLFLLTRWVYAFAICVLASAALALDGEAGAAAIAAAGGLALPFTVVYFAFVERASTAFRPLRPRFCSIYQPNFWRHERYWKLATIPLRILNGTPFKGLAWRAHGVRIGKRVFDDGALIMDKSMVALGDDCALNAGSIVQPHSQEDGTFKSDRITIGAGCTVGVGALVHYGVTMGDGATLAPDSFLMKGEEVPPNTRWGMNPAREVREPIGEEGQPDEDRQLSLGADTSHGFTAIPRWTPEPVAGVAEHRAVVPEDVATAASRLADEMAVPLSTVLLTAHARVLASLTGEGEIATGYVPAAGDPPLPCQLETEADSWRALLLDASRVESELRSRRSFAVADLHETALPESSFETVLDPTGDGVHPTEDSVLRVAISERGGDLSLRLTYRTDALDANSAARFAGYHVAALGLMGADPDAQPARHSLLSEEELRFQLDGLAGPHRKLPERRFHELFEERAAAHPEAVAAVHAGRAWTYAELNARANRLGRALLARGLRREEVVAVVSERNLDWMAAVLAVFKAGGVYLPIEPHLPAGRIVAMLRRAGCELVLSEHQSTTNLQRSLESLPGVETLLIDEAIEEHAASGDLGVEVGPDQLAYIYFTSGSTGEPKGAMCEHAGMLNHLYAKIDDLEISEGQVVAQTAPQSFDISLWQLTSALLVGGRTLLVEQELILDVERFVETIADRRVNVLQVVPSYLELVVSYLEQVPRRLPDLRCVSVTGEPVTKELLRRWFAVAPDVKVVNAYGLTETSDDTNHEVMGGPPTSDRVPLGRPVNNVRVYVVDERLMPVPLGAPGEIVVSGVCVGRGYVNDPERTRRAFIADPHREGQRLYRSGDYGRWWPDGKLEFLGRRDAQVKIRGFRIEIGEVESALSGVPGIRAAAAVVAERSVGGKRLVAFYVGRPFEVEALRASIEESLPSYMVPSAFHQRERLPLTANGKVDRKALTALAAEVETG